MSRQERKKMQSLRHMPAEEAFDRATERAEKAAEAAKAAKAGGKKPLFLWLKPGHKALIRPLCPRLSGGVKLMKHNQWNKDRDLNISSICACELEPAKPCLYCEMAKENKKLTAGEWFFLPVYVYQVTDSKNNIVTYEEKQEDGSKVEKEVKGVVRLLELTPFGRVGPLFHYFRKFPNDPDNCLLNECDFTIEQIGEGSEKNFQPIHKNAKPMHDRIKAISAQVTEQSMYERIIAFCPPKVSEDNSNPFEDAPRKGKASDDNPFEENMSDSDFELTKNNGKGVDFGKHLKSAPVAEEPLDDTITDW
ncbi:MAG TPA: hypothetical protein VF974_00825 [Patescibacteria group bacterium]